MTVPPLKAIHIEITTKCIARCAYCPHDIIKRRGREMDIAFILDLAAQARDMGAADIHPHLLGEPTMHSRYATVLAKLKESCPDMRIVEYTNGWGLRRRYIRDAINAHVDKLTISIDGADQPGEKQFSNTVGAWQRMWRPYCDRTSIQAVQAFRDGIASPLPLRGEAGTVSLGRSDSKTGRGFFRFSGLLYPNKYLTML